MSVNGGLSVRSYVAPPMNHGIVDFLANDEIDEELTEDEKNPVVKVEPTNNINMFSSSTTSQSNSSVIQQLMDSSASQPSNPEQMTIINSVLNSGPKHFRHNNKHRKRTREYGKMKFQIKSEIEYPCMD